MIPSWTAISVAADGGGAEAKPVHFMMDMQIGMPIAHSWSA